MTRRRGQRFPPEMDGGTFREAAVPVAVPVSAPDGLLRVLLVNNASEPAFIATERRFRRLLERATDGRARVEIGVLAGTPGASLAGTVAAERLLARRPDMVVVTGAEPSQHRLQDEPFWLPLARLFRWAESTGTPLLLSCLAAHAAMLHAAGIGRVLLARKLFGLYAEAVSADDPLAGGLPAIVAVPHSRWGTLPLEALQAAGGRILSRSPAAGAGFFVLERGAPWLCLQGHPEYGCNSLGREYARDLARFTRGEQKRPPERPEVEPGVQAGLSPDAWQAPAARLIGNWLAGHGATLPRLASVAAGSCVRA